MTYLRFGIRDLLWAMLVLGLVIGWWLDHQRLVAALEATADVTGMVTIDGRPLATGRIYFSRDQGNFVGSEITDGRFTIPTVPVGQWSVGIEGEAVPPLYESGMTAHVGPRTGEFQFDLQGKKPLNPPPTTGP